MAKKRKVSATESIPSPLAHTMLKSFKDYLIKRCVPENDIQLDFTLLEMAIEPVAHNKLQVPPAKVAVHAPQTQV